MFVTGGFYIELILNRFVTEDPVKRKGRRKQFNCCVCFESTFWSACIVYLCGCCTNCSKCFIRGSQALVGLTFIFTSFNFTGKGLKFWVERSAFLEHYFVAVQQSDHFSLTAILLCTTIVNAERRNSELCTAFWGISTIQISPTPSFACPKVYRTLL